MQHPLYYTMFKNTCKIIIIILIFSQLALAQKPIKPNATEIFHQIEKLNFLGSVLYIAAHPDDENTRLISYLSNKTNARTGYLSLTRGDGGQNLIGPELRELLGVIRTQELIEARKIDGGEQLFTRANDFGFSKNPEETLAIWDKNQVLADVILAIRKFQPDIIINRFDHRTSGTTHGHHTASALLSMESFDLANNPSVFPNQLKLFQPWQPKRMYFNTSWWFYGSKEKFDKADKSKLVQLETGVYYPTLGKSNQEIAALSRSCHQSQGFGNTGTRGEESEYLEFIKGEISKESTNLFEGIDTSWNRIKGGSEIGKILGSVQENFDFKNPALSIPELLKAYDKLQLLEETHWKQIKSEELRKIIAACTGLYLEAVSDSQTATENSSVKIKIEAINRSDVPIVLESVMLMPTNQKIEKNIALKNNIVSLFSLDFEIPMGTNATNPYWLDEKATTGMYHVSELMNIGTPDVIRKAKVLFNLKIDNINFTLERTITYKYNDEVKGETYQPFDILPEVTSAFTEKVVLFTNEKEKTIGIKITAEKDNCSGDLTLELPENWLVIPSKSAFELAKKGDEKTIYFKVIPPKKSGEIVAKSLVYSNGRHFEKELFTINYGHILKQHVLKNSVSNFVTLDLKIGKEKVAYLMGAGDEVPIGISQMGYDVTVLSVADVSKENLLPFDVIITGIRAYNVVNELALKQELLFDFVNKGKTMIVQYNTSGDLVTEKIAPFPLKIGRDRVTEENASVRFLAPNHSVLNYPNQITTADFIGWKQEQGLYYPQEWDHAFIPILSSNDSGETPKNGGLLIAKYGKGHYIYTGLSFFRELPEGVPGAFRLLANLISIR